MAETTGIPREAAALASDHLALTTAAGLRLDGLYLVGSVALGDFQPGRSDVDFVAVLGEPATDRDLAMLGDVHEALARATGPSFDGVYLTRSQLRDPPPPLSRAPFALDGAFHADAPCGELSPVLFDSLRQCGIAIAGPPVAALGIVHDRLATSRFLRANLAGYWASWCDAVEAALAAKRPGQPVSADALSWGVLGVSRMAATLATGRIVSKSDAGRWAQSLDGAAPDVLHAALAARLGEIDALTIAEARAALDYVRSVVDSETAALTPLEPRDAPIA